MANNSIAWLIVAVLLVGGVSYWAMNKDKTSTYVPEDVTPGPTPSPTPSPSQSTAGEPVVSTGGATFISQSGAVLNGEVNPNGVQTSYWYEYGLTDALGIATRAQLIGGGFINYKAPAAVASLRASTTYYFRIVAQNQYGKVYGAVSDFKTTNTPPPAYIGPTAATRPATNLTTVSATLNGSTNPHGSTTYYWFEYGTDFSLGFTTATASAGMGASQTTVTSPLSGLSPNTTYFYRFNAQNGYGTANGNILSFTTNPVNPPTPPVGNPPATSTSPANNITKNTATLHGQVNPNGVATTYYFEYGKSTLFGIFSLEKKTSEKSAGKGTELLSFPTNISGLDADSTYYYQIVAKNQYGTTNGGIYSFTTKN